MKNAVKYVMSVPVIVMIIVGMMKQEIMEISEDDDIYESLLSGGYFEEDDELDLWLWGVS